MTQTLGLHRLRDLHPVRNLIERAAAAAGPCGHGRLCPVTHGKRVAHSEVTLTASPSTPSQSSHGLFRVHGKPGEDWDLNLTLKRSTLTVRRDTTGFALAR